MRTLLSLTFVLLFIQNTFAQQGAKKVPVNTGNEPSHKSFVFNKQTTVNFNDIKVDYSPKLMVNEMPKQGAEKMVKYNYPENTKPLNAKSNNAPLPPLVKGLSFQGNTFGISTPNDNDMAISDSGRMISVINTNIHVRNVTTGSISPYKSLAAFTASVNNLHQEFDPKVIYDPLKDRFVLVCLVGFVDTTSKIIVGFSQTNNPAGNWNLYTLPGDPLNYGLWSDYPMLSMTEKELFLSVNYLYNNSSWQTGFVETIVWQMKKDSGYVGLPLNSTLHHNIKYNNKFIRNLCPVKGGSHLYTPNMYFISNRNLASQNDTVFLVNITDTIGAPTQTVTVKSMTASVPYYFPPSGRQTNTVQELATNDCRNLGAFYENNKIQYVHNTRNPTNSLVTVYYGVIENPAATNPTVTGYYIQNDSVDFAYPNISYAGTSSSDQTSIISFDHSSPKIFAGCSAVRADAQGNFSPILRIQNGATFVNLLTSNLERWGDYSGSQRRYSNPGEVWMSGYYAYAAGSYFNAHGAWIAQLGIGGVATGVAEQTETTSSANVFPNPTTDVFTVAIHLQKPEYLSFELYDAQGKQIAVLLRDWVKALDNSFSFRTDQLPKGVYILKITGNYNTNITKKVIVD
ncbi:MAG: T9SS type A sorting domain-containing protein [Sphingobacteriaceae bacterium]